MTALCALAFDAWRRSIAASRGTAELPEDDERAAFDAWWAMIQGYEWPALEVLRSAWKTAVDDEQTLRRHAQAFERYAEGAL